MHGTSAAVARPFPWTMLDRVPREAAGRLAVARRALARAVDPATLAAALGAHLGQPVRVLHHEARVDAAPPAPLGPAVTLATADGAARVAVEVDRDLARRLVAVVVERAAALGDPSQPFSPALHGALAAVVAHLARRAHGDRGALVPVGPGGLATAPSARRVRIDAQLLVGDEALAVRATVDVDRFTVADDAPARDVLARLGATPLSLAIVGASSAAPRAEVHALARGDAWLPGRGWSVARREGRLVGDVLLVAPGAERAIAARLDDLGRLTVLGAARAPIEVEEMEAIEREEATTAVEAVIDAPVVVRVEVGAVTLPARAWAAVAAGDVLALGVRVGEPVTLRVAGAEVARGELVDLDGELGVRVVARREPA